MHLSRDDGRVARLIEQAIPDSLRLAKHPDAELVNLAIATVLLAVRDSHSFTLRGQRNDVRKALEGYFEHTFAPHIAQEDEDWSSMKSRAASADEIRKELHEAIGNAVHAFKEQAEGFSQSQYDRAMAAFRANPNAVVSDVPGTTLEDRAKKSRIRYSYFGTDKEGPIVSAFGGLEAFDGLGIESMNESLRSLAFDAPNAFGGTSGGFEIHSRDDGTFDVYFLSDIDGKRQLTHSLKGVKPAEALAAIHRMKPE